MVEINNKTQTSFLNFKELIKYITKEKTDDLQVSLSIQTHGAQNGVPHETSVFQWSEQHFNKFKFNNQKVVKDIGTYEAIITFPGNILNSSKYSLNVSLAYAVSWHEQIKEKILFELDDSGSSHTLKSGRSSGLIAIPLDWSETKTND